MVMCFDILGASFTEVAVGARSGLLLTVAAVPCAAGMHVSAVIIGLPGSFATLGTRVTFKVGVVEIRVLVIWIHGNRFWFCPKIIF